MNRAIFTLVATGLLVAAVQAPAQVCNPNITPTAPDNRYTDNGDGTVTDNRTGLMWKQCVEGLSNSPACDTGSAATYTWQEALAQAQTVNGTGFAGYSDWRLPNRKELASLIERACYYPAINITRFPATPSNHFWHSSPDYSTDGYVWSVSFYIGAIVGSDAKFNHNSVRLVRGQ